jgi:hypothetical protein
MKLIVIAVKDLPLIKENQPNFIGTYVSMVITAIFASLL